MMLKGGTQMKVYLKNEFEQQTVRDLDFIQALKLRIWVWIRYPKTERPIVRFVIWKEKTMRSFTDYIKQEMGLEMPKGNVPGDWFF